MLVVTLATLALALPALAPQASLVLNLDTMHVTLDDALPRPTRVLHVNKATTTDFSPPLAAPIAPPPPPTPHWWRYVADHALLAAVGGEGCIPPHCRTAGPFRKGQGATQCAGMCNTTASCAGWNVVKDTATSGQHGKGDLCELYESAGLAKASPFYTADGNFDCGSKSQLQPDPPSGGLHGSRPPQAVPCVAVVAANGTITQFCTDRDEASTAYGSRQTNHSADSVQWKLTLVKTDHGTGRITVRLTGRVAIEADPQNANISVLSWSLLSARSDQLEVRAIDLGFAFVGLSGSGDGYYFTSATKTWCPPGVTIASLHFSSVAFKYSSQEREKFFHLSMCVRRLCRRGLWRMEAPDAHWNCWAYRCGTGGHNSTRGRTSKSKDRFSLSRRLEPTATATVGCAGAVRPVAVKWRWGMDSQWHRRYRRILIAAYASVPTVHGTACSSCTGCGDDGGPNRFWVCTNQH